MAAAPASGAPAPPMEQTRPSPSIDNMQAMLNLVLVQSGRYLRELRSASSSSDAESTGRQTFQMKRAVPAAMERFQDSLDELESELHLAQAVLRRDLAVMQNARLEKERKEREERERRENAKKATPVKPQPSPEQKKTLSAKPEAVAVELPPEQPAAKEELKKDPEPPPPIDTTKEVAERDPLFDPTPTTANPQDQEFDFDAMFGDPTLDDPANGNEDAMDTSAPDLNFTLDDPDAGPSLLRGLEDFAKSSDDPAPADAPNDNDTLNLDDFTMPDLPDLPTTQPDDPQPQPEATKAPEATMTEPTLDTTTNDFDRMMDTTTDLDDLFNMDPDNPETTAFDDAFTFFDAN